MSKPYTQMTAAEKLADRIAKTREIDRRVQEAKSASSAPRRSSVIDERLQPTLSRSSSE
jgi:hypothetical protein